LSISTEKDERAPWTVARVIAEISRLGPTSVREPLAALRGDTRSLIAALRAGIDTVDGRSKVTAAAMLLLLQDDAGRDVFLDALSSPAAELRNWAIDFVYHVVAPYDTDSPGQSRTKIPISADEIFDRLKRDLHEPWTGLSERILQIALWNDFPQARPITRPLLAHPSKPVRKKVAEAYLRRGRDEGAFQVLEEFFREAPLYVAQRDPQWRDWYHVKSMWHSIEEGVRHGSEPLRNKAALLAMQFLSGALDAPDPERRFDFNEGFVDAITASQVLALVMPEGARRVLERVKACDAVGGYARGRALVAYAQALGDQSRPAVLSALTDAALRKYAAEAMAELVKDRNDPSDITALSDALSGEKRSDVVAALARALMAAGPQGRPHVQSALDDAEPWARFELAWRIEGGSDRELADLLTEAGVMDAVTDEQLAQALSGGFDLRSLIWAGGERLVLFNVKSWKGLEHFQLFQDLLKAARPIITVDELTEICDATVRREPVPGAKGVEKVVDLGTVCTIRFKYQGSDFDIEAHPQGRWHDVAAVMNGFDAFMQSIGRDDRCYELEGGGKWAMLVVAPASRFGPLAARLRIPLERDPVSARDSAKAYQRQIQNM
jgi:hypothetical protein